LIALADMEKAAPEDLPILILLDINMPYMNGFQVCEHLKLSDRTREIPIIFVSARDEVLDKIRAFDIGAVDYITKPFQIAELLARVENQVVLRKLRHQLQQQNEQLQQEIKHRIIAEAALKQANVKLVKLVNLDGLTELANRRRFDEYIETEWHRLAREGRSLSLIMCDIDFFKNYNDAYGHIVGDACLRRVSQMFRDLIHRPADLAARYGGEEFAFVLPSTELEGAMIVAQSIHDALLQLEIPHEGSAVSEFVTVSMGVTSLVPMNDSVPSVLLTAADYALYRAKELGRNQTYAIG
jgi:diguanylate cyclase (GGDEF)-like protein